MVSVCKPIVTWDFSLWSLVLWTSEIFISLSQSIQIKSLTTQSKDHYPIKTRFSMPDFMKKTSQTLIVTEYEVGKNIFLFTCEKSSSPIYFLGLYISQNFHLHMYTHIYSRNSPMDFNSNLNTFINPAL